MCRYLNGVCRENSKISHCYFLLNCFWAYSKSMGQYCTWQGAKQISNIHMMVNVPENTGLCIQIISTGTSKEEPNVKLTAAPLTGISHTRLLCHGWYFASQRRLGLLGAFWSRKVADNQRKPQALAELVTGRLIEDSMNAKNFRGLYTINNFYLFNWGGDRDNTAFFI